MKTLRLAVLATFALALTACPPPDDDAEDRDDVDEIEVAEETTVNLSEIDDSGISGEASLMALNGQTDVRLEVDADDDRADAQVMAAIYRERCDAVRDRRDRNGDRTGTADRDTLPDDADRDDHADHDMERGEQVAELAAVTLDAQGRGAESTTVQQNMERLVDGNHSLQLRVDGNVVACGDIDEPGMGW